ncbi:MAG: DEAD/DEAH box helicase, partial [Pseudomonadota bacterium]
MSGRPECLFPLFAEVQTLSGIGPKTAGHMAALGVQAPRDLLFTLPQSGIDRRRRETIRGVVPPATVTVAVQVGAHAPARSKGGAYRISVQDAETSFQLVFFHARGDYWKNALPEGSRRVVSGRLEMFDGVAQMVHPDHIVAEADASDIPDFEPVYPLTSGVTQKLMFKATRGAVDLLPALPEWIDPTQKAQAGWPDFGKAVWDAHHPSRLEDVAATAPARERLAYDELLAHQLTLALARARERRKSGRVTAGDGHLQAKVIASLPYRPTTAQARAIDEINADMASPTRMNRLLQGDVGAGKTLVAFMALVRAVEGGGQGVLLAPTESLARQHLESLLPLADEAGVVLEVLTGRDKGAERRRKLEALA